MCPIEGVLGEVLVDAGDLDGEEVDLAQARRDGVALVEWQLELGQPLASALAEQVAGRWAALEVPDEHGGRFVLDARALTHKLCTPRGQTAQRTGGLVADPHAGDQIEANSSARVRASKRSFLTFAWQIARTCIGLASTTSATCGSRILAIASALPVDSSTMRSMRARLPANRLQRLRRRVDPAGGAGLAGVEIATSQKSR
jgi:hypothetical protein